MNTVTKVFVVLLTISSIAFVMAVVSHVAKEQDWKALSDEYRNQAINAQATLSNTLGVTAAEKQAQALKIQALTNTNAEQLGMLSRAEAARDAARAELASALHDKAAFQSTVSKLTGQLELVTREAEQLRTQRNELDTQYVDLQKRNADLADRNRELSIQNMTMSDQIRQFQQQLYAKDEEISRLARASGAPPAAVAPIVSQGLDPAKPSAPPSGLSIQGHVEEVQGKLATISVGKADGVQPGMTFVVFRDDQYIADLVVATVEPNRAMGDLTIIEGSVRRGDKIAEESVFASRR